MVSDIYDKTASQRDETKVNEPLAYFVSYFTFWKPGMRRE